MGREDAIQYGALMLTGYIGRFPAPAPINPDKVTGPRAA
jgi:hypothetical protein